MNIGQRMKSRRKELKMSADELAARLGKDRSTIYRYEKGDIENLPIDILEPIANALSTTPAHLMGWEVEMKSAPVETADRHAEMLVDADFNELFEDFKHLSAAEKQIVKDLARSLRNAKTEA